MTEEKTIFKITIDNFNKIKSEIDLESLEGEEEALRFVHSILDEYRQLLIDYLSVSKPMVDDDDEDEEF